MHWRNGCLSARRPSRVSPVSPCGLGRSRPRESLDWLLPAWSLTISSAPSRFVGHGPGDRRRLASNSFDARFVPFFWTAHRPPARGSTAIEAGADFRLVAIAATTRHGRCQPGSRYLSKNPAMRRALRNNSLSIVLFALFFVFLAGQSVAGHRVFNEEQVDHGSPEILYALYLTEGHFVEATFENWESEFLQMFAFVLLTVYLVQRGSPESRPLDDDDEDVDADRRLGLTRRGPCWRLAAGSLFAFPDHRPGPPLRRVPSAALTGRGPGGRRRGPGPRPAPTRVCRIRDGSPVLVRVAARTGRASSLPSARLSCCRSSSVRRTPPSQRTLPNPTTRPAASSVSFMGLRRPSAAASHRGRRDDPAVRELLE